MPALILYVVIFLALLVSTLRRPAVAMTAVLCMFGYEQWAQGSNVFFVRYGMLTNFLIGSLVLIGLVGKFMRGMNIFNNYPRHGILVLLLYVYAYASAIFWSPIPEKSLELFAESFPYHVTLIILTPLLFTRSEDLVTAFAGLVPLGTLLVVLLMFSVTWSQRCIVVAGAEYLEARHGITCGNPLATAQMAGYLLFVLLLQWGQSNLLMKLFKIASAVLCLTLIIRSGSRGQLISAIVTVVMFWPVAHRIRSFGMFAGTLVVFAIVGQAILLGLQFYWGEHSKRWSEDKMGEDMEGRWEMVRTLFSHWMDGPFSIFFGLGNSASFDPRIIGYYPHIMPLEVLAEEGLIGFSLLVWICFECVRSAIRIARKCTPESRTRASMALIAAMLTYEFLLSLKQGNLLGNSAFFMFAIILGKFELIETRKKTAKGVEPAAAPRRLAPEENSLVTPIQFQDAVSLEPMEAA